MNDNDDAVETTHESAPSGAIRWLRRAMIASVLFPAALFVATAAVDYVRVTDQAHERIYKTASVAQEHALKVLETSEVILNRVLDLLGNDSDAQVRAEEPALHRTLKRAEANIEQVQAINAWTRDGDAQVSSIFYPAPEVNIADREDFTAQKAHDAGTHITRPLVGRATGEHFFNVSRRRTLPDGRFNGIVTVSLLPTYFSEFYRELAAPVDRMSIALFRSDGVLLARFPTLADSHAQLSEASGLRRFVARTGASGETRLVSEFDGKDRLLAFRKVGNYPLYVSVGLEYGAVMAEWYRNLATYALFAFPAAGALLLVTWIALKKTRREQAAIEQWRAEASRRASAEDALRQAHKLEAIGRLTGGVAHDFNNLLQVVSTNLYILKHKARSLDVEPQLAAMARAVASGETLTKHLLSFSRRRPLQPQVMRLDERMDEICNLLQHTLRGDVKLASHAGEGLWPVKADPEELELALLNVAVNARDALPAGGAVTISARNVVCAGSQAHGNLTGDFVAIAIEDNGPGIPADIIDRVFEPFFTTKDVGKGTGLGLSQVYGFAAQSGGTATIASRSGVGTMVTLYLPRAREVPAPKSVVLDVSAAATVGGSILLVEDNAEIGDAVSAVLTEMRFTVTHVKEAEAALAALAAAPGFDLLITDIVMPGRMNGLQLARTVRTRYPGLPVLLMSGYTTEANKAAAEGYRILSKPFRPETLAAAIREAMQPARTPRHEEATTASSGS